MRVSVNWLSELLPGLKIPAAEIARVLTQAGLEVEAIHDPAVQWQGVVTARVVKVEPHPSADKLRLATVDAGGAEQKVVCGAPNCREGMIVPLAKEGARLPDGTVIQAAKIRGVESRGMLCSQSELGISADKSGLWELPEGTAAGLPLADVAGDGAVLEIAVTPNRGDALSVVGIARDLAALLRLDMAEPKFQLVESGPLAKDQVAVTVENGTDCPLYCGRIVKGIRVGPSPFWLSRRLQAHGIRAISNIVDITNYILLLHGQPLHAFDLALLPSRAIGVRGARAGEKLTTLDGIERQLFEGQLTIVSGDVPVALGGVMGGKSTEVTGKTADVFIESAWFHPSAVRKSSKATGLVSESSYRFERGIDPVRTGVALDHAARMMAELGGGEVSKGRIEVSSGGLRPRELDLRPARISRILGYEIPAATVTDVLARLGMKVSGGGAALKVTVPAARHDIEREIDLIEELVRVDGYEKVPATLPAVAAQPVSDLSPWAGIESLRSLLVARGLVECITYTFVSDRWPDQFRLAANDPRRTAVKLQNAIRSDESVMRTLLLPSIAAVAKFNADHGAGRLRLFELGRVYRPVKGESLPAERGVLAALIQSPEGKTFWEQESVRGETFFEMKALVEAIGPRFHAPLKTGSRAQEPFLHPGRSAEIVLNGQTIGVYGELHPETAAAYDLKGRIAVLELETGPLVSLLRNMEQLPETDRFPPVKRDFSFVVPDTVPAGSLTALIRQAGGEMVQEVEVFDLFRGGKLPEGTHSLAVAVRLRSREGTLTEDQIRAVESRVLERLKADLGVELRH
ncbi:MAG: phenylalanine--tRNA ligase subunit beta [Deltaproteobacteria bacterium]|nr:phenylalanine--tRNA ligase subunit beta [Deltaproteobacteria bacterium]